MNKGGSEKMESARALVLIKGSSAQKLSEVVPFQAARIDILKK